MTDFEMALTRAQQVSLVLLRTLVGWHFLYEGYFKLWRPAWSHDGAPLAAWTSAGYLHAASGPFASLFNHLADSAWLHRIDIAVAAGLVLVGLSLMLGLFTQAGCAGGLALLTLFYLAQIPTAGVQLPGAEGAYLFVSKTLIEASAVLVLFFFRTGRIAGLDRLWHAPRAEVGRPQEAAS